MALRAGRRTADLTRITSDPAVAARRASLGAALMGAGGALGWRFGGWVWAVGALLVIPGATTLAAARHHYVAPCPGCGARLGAAVFVGPDEPVIARGALDHRCAACGIYVDVASGVVREVPFGRTQELPTYALALDAAALPSLAWGDRCVGCGEEGTRRLTLTARSRGLLLSEGEPGVEGAVPFCAAHGAAGARGVEVARGERVTVAFASYAAYRAFLDANRGVVDVLVRGMDSGAG
jgi:hypothetical protein